MSEGMPEGAAELEAEIAIAKARLNAMDWSYIVGKGNLEQAKTDDLCKAGIVLAYAMMDIMLHADGTPQDRCWHEFLRDALEETISKKMMAL